MIRVERRSQNEFLVIVEEQVSKTEHIVTLDEEYYEKLTGKEISKDIAAETTASPTPVIIAPCTCLMNVPMNMPIPAEAMKIKKI